MPFTFAKRSHDILEGVHPDLRAVMYRAIIISDVEFVCYDGKRTEKKQREYVASGASQTMKSRHLTGHAVDVYPVLNGKPRWDWPLYHKIAEAVKQAAKQLEVAIVWGGDWKNFPDGPHFELDVKEYP